MKEAEFTNQKNDTPGEGDVTSPNNKVLKDKFKHQSTQLLIHSLGGKNIIGEVKQRGIG